MRVDTEFAPELCASKDLTRATIAVVHLDVEGKRLVATNGHMMAIVPCVPENGDTTGPIAVAQMKQARKLAKSARFAESYIRANGSVKLCAGENVVVSEEQRPQVDSFPPIDQVIPQECDDDFIVGINAAYLVELAKAIGATTGKQMPVTLRIPKDGLSPIRVTTTRNPDALGILMPTRVK